MLSAIDLDDQMEFSANEVADLATDRNLPDKLISIDLPIANTIPENRLCVSLIDPQSPCDSGGLFTAATHCLAPHPDHKSDPTSTRKRAGRG
jgi:hypothetical protein